MRRKKILAVAVAGALGCSAGTALAAGGAESNYTIYGKLYPQVSSYDYDGATRAGNNTPNSMVQDPTATADHLQRSTIDVSNSRIGFRGSEKLNNSLTAVFQIEQRVRFDNGTGTWAGNRDSFIGLSGSYMGTIKLGNMDTSYKQVGDQLSFLGISSGNFVSNSNYLSRGPIDGIDFHLRQPNVIQYDSPKLAGFQVLGSWGKDEFKGNPGRGINGLLTSFGATYEMGPIYAALGYESHHDFFAYSTNTANPFANPTTGSDVRSKDTAKRATVTGKFGNTTLSLDYAQIELNETGNVAAGRFMSYENNRIALGIEQKFGPWTGAISLVDSDKGTCTREGGATCDTSGLDGRIINFGVSYSFSRRTLAFLLFTQAKNGQSARYNPVAINPSAGTDPQQGEDVTAIGAGVSHSF